MMRFSLLLLACLTLVLMAAGDAKADDLTPLWSDQPSSSYNPTSVSVSRDGSVIALTSYNDEIYLYSRNNSNPEWSYDTGKDVLSSAVSGDGKYLVVGLGWSSSLGRVILFETNSSTPLWTQTVSGHLYSVAISYNGSYIVTGGQEGKLRLYSKDSDSPLAIKTVADVNEVAISDDGLYYAAVCDNDKLYFYKRGNESSWTKTLGGDAVSLALTPDGKNIAVGSDDEKIYLYSFDENDGLDEQWNYDAGDTIWGLDISDDGSIVAAGTRGNGTISSNIFLLNSTGSQIWSSASSNEVAVDQVVLSGDGSYLLAGDNDGGLLLFDTGNSTPYGEYEIGSFLTNDEYSPQQLAISYLGDWFTGTSTEKYLRFFRNPDNFAPYILETYPANGARVTGSTTALSWSVTDYESNDTSLKYSVFFGTDKDNLSLASDNQTATSWTTTTLTRGTTYWWQLRAYDGNAYRYSSKVSFTRNTLPVVNQTSPVDDSYIPDRYSLTFYFQASDTDSDDLSFELYMGTESSNLQYKANSTTNHVTIDDYELNQTYYWKIRANDGFEDVDSTIKQFVVFDSPIRSWIYNTNDDVSAVAISGDGKYITIAAGSQSKRVYFFSKDNNTPLWNYLVGYRVYSVAISSNGEYVVAGTASSKVYLFDKDSSSPIWSYTAGNHVDTVAISADGEYIIAGSYDGKLYLFDKDSSTPLWSYEFSDEPESIAISADGEYIAASSENKVYLFGKDSSTPLWSYSTGGDARAVSISADGEYIVAGSDNKQVFLFDKDSSTPLWSYTGGSAVRAVAISSNGTYITAGSGNSIYFFDRDSSTPLWSYNSNLNSMGPVAISADGEYITSGCACKNTYLFDKDSSTPLWVYNTDDAVQGIDISADGNHIIAGSYDDSLYFLPRNKVDLDWSHKTNAGDLKVAISADGEYIAACNGYPGNTVYLFDKNSSTPLWTYSAGYGTPSAVKSVAISADGEYIAAGGYKGSYDGIVYLFHKDSSTPLWSYTTENDVRSVSISADGEYITAGSQDGNVYLFEKDSSTPLWNYDTGDGYVRSVAISADGEYIAAGSDDHKVYLFEKDSSTPLWSYSTEQDVRTVAISADGEYIAAGSHDDKVYLFDKDSSTPLWSYETGDTVLSISISANGEYIAAGSDDDKVYLFDKDSSTPFWSYDAGGAVRSVSISADGEYIVAVTGSSDYKVYLFDKDSSTPLWNYDTPVSSVAISEDGEYIAAGFSDKKVYSHRQFWPLINGTFNKDVYATDEFPAVITPEYFYADSNITHYKWMIGNTTYSTTSSWTLTNLSTGTYYATHKVSTDNSVWISHDFNFTITVRPVAYLDEYPTGVDNAGSTLSFSGFGTDDDTVVEYRWFSSIDGVISTSDEFEISTLSNGSHSVAFTVRDNDGVWSNPVFANFTVNGRPIVSINGPSNDSIFIDDDTVSFSASASDDQDGLDYLWYSSRDGELSTSLSFSTDSLTNGTHNIYFNATDVHNYTSETDSIQIYINGRPIATFNSHPTGLRSEGETLVFNGSGSDDGQISGYQWNSSIDGIFSSSSYVEISTLSNGTHQVKFRVKDNGSVWSNYIQFNFAINGKPRVSITSPSDDTTFVDDDTVSFSANATDDQSGLDYLWYSSRDGELSTSLSFSTDSLTNGTHTIYFNATDVYNYTSETDSIQIYINGRPIASFNSHPTGLRSEGETLVFNGSGSDDGQISGYQWNSSIDGIFSSSSYVAISTLSNGTHEIKFRVKDNGSVWSNYIQFNFSINGRPQVSIEGPSDDQTFVDDDTVSFSANATDDQDGLDYLWYSSRDGELSTSLSFSTDSLTNGTHNIYFNATDVHNYTSETDSIQIYINGRPVIVSLDVPDSGDEGIALNFSVIATDDNDNNLSYEWVMETSPNSTFYYKQNITHSFSETGEITVELTVTDDYGASRAVNFTVSISNQAPIIHYINVTPPSADEGEAIAFSAHATDYSDDDLTYTWTFGSKGTKYGANVSFTFDDDGNYTVNLSVADDDGGYAYGEVPVNISNVSPQVEDIVFYEEIDEGEHNYFGCTVVDPGDDTTYFSWDFGDGTVFNSNNFTLEFGDDRMVSFYLNLSDEDGGFSSQTYTFEVKNVNPELNNIIFEGAMEEGTTFQATAYAFDPGDDIVTYTWLLENGTEEYGSQISLYYADDGQYTFDLRLQDEDGGYSANQREVSISNLVPVILSYTFPDYGVEGEEVNFSAEAHDVAADELTYFWYFEDSGSYYSESNSTTNSWNDKGHYEVILQVSDNNFAGGGEVAEVSHTIEIVNGPPEIIEYVVTETGYEGLYYYFSASAYDSGEDEEQLDFIWTVAGITYHGQVINVSFDDDGTYGVSLRVEDSNGAHDNQSSFVTIFNLDPLVETYEISDGDEGQNLIFSAEVYDMDPVSLTWNFGDGEIAGGNFIEHVYDDDGGFRVTLTANDDDGGVTVIEKNITIRNLDPVITSYEVPSNTTEGTLKTWTCEAMDVEFDMADLEYTWAVDNISTYFSSSMNHTFTDNGNFEIKLSVIDGDGGITEMTFPIEVSNVEPEIEELVFPESADEGQIIDFFAVASDPGDDELTYEWTFGDGSIASGPSTSHTYQNNGYFVLELLVSDDDGGSHLRSENITVLNVAPSIENIEFKQSSLDSNYRVNDEVLSFSIGNVIDPGDDELTFVWDFGDGSGQVYGENVSHTYTDAGVYSASVCANDGDEGVGCYDFKITIAKDYTLHIGAGTLLTAIGLLIIRYRYRKSSRIQPAPSKQTPVSAEMTAIECPSCGAQMEVPKLGMMQEVACSECGLSGEIEI